MNMWWSLNHSEHHPSLALPPVFCDSCMDPGSNLPVCEYVVCVCVNVWWWEGPDGREGLPFLPPSSPIPVLGPSPCVHPPALNPLYVGGGEWEGVVVVLVNVYMMHRRRGSAPLHVRTPTEGSVLEDQVAARCWLLLSAGL